MAVQRRARALRAGEEPGQRLAVRDPRPPRQHHLRLPARDRSRLAPVLHGRDLRRGQGDQHRPRLGRSGACLPARPAARLAGRGRRRRGARDRALRPRADRRAHAGEPRLPGLPRRGAAPRARDRGADAGPPARPAGGDRGRGRRPVRAARARRDRPDGGAPRARERPQARGRARADGRRDRRARRARRGAAVAPPERAPDLPRDVRRLRRRRGPAVDRAQPRGARPGDRRRPARRAGAPDAGAVDRARPAERAFLAVTWASLGSVPRRRRPVG